MKPWSVLAFSSLSMAACAKPPTIIKVKVADTYQGYMRIEPCIPGAPEPTVLDETSSGLTAQCPSGNVIITVITPTKTFDVPAEKVHVRNLSNGKPILITTEIP
jgi:hypothetical protein